MSGDEVDQKDETICPHDYATAGMISDDVFRSAFQGVANGVNLDVIFDSCHSGTGTREMAALASRPGDESFVVRFIEPPIDYGYFLDANPTIPVRGIFRGTREEDEDDEQGARQVVVVAGLNHVLWAGCRDNQTSARVRSAVSFAAFSPIASAASCVVPGRGSPDADSTAWSLPTSRLSAMPRSRSSRAPRGRSMRRSLPRRPDGAVRTGRLRSLRYLFCCPPLRRLNSSRPRSSASSTATPSASCRQPGTRHPPGRHRLPRIRPGVRQQGEAGHQQSWPSARP